MVKTGSMNMAKAIRRIGHRSGQARKMTFYRTAIQSKDDYGVESTTVAAGNEGLTIPNIDAFIAPIVTQTDNFTRAGHTVVGSATIYIPSLSTIKNNILGVSDSGAHSTTLSSFNELESKDILYDMEQIIYNPSDSPVNDGTGSDRADTWNFFTGQTLPGFQMDRLQFKIRRIIENSGTTIWNGILVDKIDEIKIIDDNNDEIVLEATSPTLAPRVGPNNVWNTFDLPIMGLSVGDKMPYYLNGYYLEFNVKTVGFDIKDMEGSTNTIKQVQIIFAESVNLEFKDVYLYKAGEWRINAIKEYRDEYMELACAKIRGERGSRRRAY